MATISIHITGGRIIDPSQGIDGDGELLLVNGRVAAVGKVTREHLDQARAASSTGIRTIDARGLVVTPGWIDLHAHLREPGGESAETIETGAMAAARGGYTTVACQPDTNPPIDSESAVEYIRLQSERAHGADVFSVAALTAKREGISLSEIGLLSRAGAVAFCDSQPIRDTEVLLKGLKYAAMFGKMVIDIPMDPWLGGGQMNAGLSAALAGLSGSPSVAEELGVARGCLLARESRGRYHAAMVSTTEALRHIAHAKSESLAVSCAVSPVHLLLTDEIIRERYDSRYKLQPPLRTAADAHSLMRGLALGTVDCVVSGHAPVPDEKKAVEFDLAPFGGSTLEVTMAAAIEALYHRGGMSLEHVIRAASTRPAELLGLSDRGTLRVGARADVSFIEVDRRRSALASDFVSKSHVCPLDGVELRGWPVGVIVGGVPVGVDR